MSAVTDTCHGNKVAAHWSQKLENRRAQKSGILDSGATSGAAPVEDEGSFEDSGQMSSKIFMLPDKQTHRATKKIRSTQRIPSNHTRKLHDLLLINNNSVRVGENFFHLRKKSFDVCREGGPNPAQPAATVSSIITSEASPP
jgi:hypothetical protein